MEGGFEHRKTCLLLILVFLKFSTRLLKAAELVVGRLAWLRWALQWVFMLMLICCLMVRVLDCEKISREGFYSGMTGAQNLRG
ncbi:hypothetical protein KC325_g210 [Hortaea werneckii]|nr:hypothetical protein KC325_g210 [Hortaea werneckii]